MKRALVFALFIFSVKAISAQGKLEGGVFGEYYQLGDNSQTQFGAILHIPIQDRFTLNYQFGLGPRQDGGYYMHSPPGVIIAGWLLLNGRNLSGLSYLGYLAIVVPQGVGMYFGKGKIVSHVSIDPLSVDFWHRNYPYDEKWKLGCNFTYRVKMLSDLKYPIFIAPQITATCLYTPGTLSPFGVRAGVTIGLQAKEAPDEPIINLDQ